MQLYFIIQILNSTLLDCYVVNTILGGVMEHKAQFVRFYREEWKTCLNERNYVV